MKHLKKTKIISLWTCFAGSFLRHEEGKKVVTCHLHMAGLRQGSDMNKCQDLKCWNFFLNIYNLVKTPCQNLKKTSATTNVFIFADKLDAIKSNKSIPFISITSHYTSLFSSSI